MKKLLLLAAVMVTSLVCMAQQPTDSISVMFKHLQNSNAEIVRLNDNIKTHANMVGAGGALMLMGTICTVKGSSDLEDGHPGGARLVKAGAWLSVAGLAVIAASIVPITKNKVKLDERGLIVDLP